MCPGSDAENTVAADGLTKAVPGIECLLFRCCGQLLGCETSQTAKIIPLTRLVPLPRASGVVAGLFNYRGRILGAIDIRTLLAADLSVAPAWQWLVVLKGKQFLAGLLIDEVAGIEEIPETELVNSADDWPGFLPKIFMVDGQEATLLAVDTLLAHPAVLVTQ